MRNLFIKPGPRETREFRRIIGLPRRSAQKLGEAVCTPLSELLRKPAGTMVLFPLQAVALLEAHDFGGIVVLLSVGRGKTLVSFLLPTVMEAERPLLIVPGKLRNKTEIEFRELAKHWYEPRNLKICSYEYVSTHAEYLDIIKPDLIIADESHKIKEKTAGCTRRIWKYWYKNECRFVPMSGTLAKRSFFDWHHLQMMALPDGLAVLPYGWKEAEWWSRALDEKVKNRAGLGVLKYFGSTLEKAREGFGKHLQGIPGIIAADSTDVDSSLYIEIQEHRFPEIDKAIKHLLSGWELPDGTEIMEGSEVWRHSRELANGFYYRWIEQPSFEWLEARRFFHHRVREILKGSRTYETPKQITDLICDEPVAQEWRKQKELFEPETEAVWIKDLCPFWMGFLSGDSTLLWYEHKAVGKLLASSDVPVYGSQGCNIKTRKSIYDEKKSCAVSVKACGEGFNLQKWNRNVILNHIPTGNGWEQTLGRTHRYGQEADEVEVIVLATAQVQKNDFNQALADARYIEATTGQSQKLCFADIIKSEDEMRY